MSYFRLYVFDRCARVVQSFDVIAPEHANAILRARREMNDIPDSAGYELWQATRRRLGERGWNWLLTRKETRGERWQTA